MGGGRVSVVRVWGYGWGRVSVVMGGGRVSVVRVWGHGWGSGVCCEGVGPWVGSGVCCEGVGPWVGVGCLL